jgi:hypothetical protein
MPKKTRYSTFDAVRETVLTIRNEHKDDGWSPLVASNVPASDLPWNTPSST